MTGARLIEITDASDPAIAEFCNIKERDLTGRAGQFIAEGTVVLRMLAEAHLAGNGITAEKILLLDRRVAGLTDILARFPTDIPVFVATAAVLDQIAGFHLHRGVLALGRRVEVPDLAAPLAQLPETSLVLVGIGMSNHDNVGSMFRNAAAFGVDHFFLDETSCDPLYRKSIRVSVGSVLSVSWSRTGSAADVLNQLEKSGFEIWGLSPGGQHDLRHVNLPKRVALVMGTEGEGLPQLVMDKINTMRIAQKEGLDSLNVATATGIALYEVSSRMGLI